jgi:ComF family protein
MFPLRPAGVNQASARRFTPLHRLRTRMASWPARLHEWLLPPRCLLCDGPGQAGLLDLCAGCQRDLPPAPAPPATAAQFDLVCCPHAYAWPIDTCVLALKFRGERGHGRVLGELLGRARLALGPPWPDVVVPVPLHARRLAERGYNQAAELARHAAHRVARPCRPRALQRLRLTRPQSGLGAAERIANVVAAFAAGEPVAGLRIALVDDVVTTGSTAAAAAVALRAAGATSVELWAAAAARRRRPVATQ